MKVQHCCLTAIASILGIARSGGIWFRLIWWHFSRILLSDNTLVRLLSFVAISLLKEQGDRFVDVFGFGFLHQDVVGRKERSVTDLGGFLSVGDLANAEMHFHLQVHPATGVSVCLRKLGTARGSSPLR